MYWSREMPKRPGKYVVRTIRSFSKTNQVLEAIYHGKEKWSFTNQTFLEYLVEK